MLVRTLLIRRPVRLAVLLPLLWTSAACAGTEVETGATAVVRDSAGISIVETPGPWGPLATVSLGAGPSLDLGALDGPAEFQFFRLGDGTRLPDGRIAVVDGGSSSVRVFGPDGSYLATWGGKGEGPGEFMAPTNILLWDADSVAVWDNQLRRLSVFDAAGAFVRTLPLPAIEGMDFANFSHRTDDGILGVTNVVFMDDSSPDGFTRLPVRVALVRPDEGLVADLGEHPGPETFMRVTETSVNILRIPFARGYVVRGAGAETLVAATDRMEFRYFGADGTLVRIVRLDQPARPVTDAVVQAEVERRVDAAPEQARAGIRSMFQEVPVPDSLPAFSEARTDARGFTWVRPFRLAEDSGPERWFVLDPSGVAMGTVSLPQGLEVWEIGSDYLLGRWTDELDIEHVQLWPLQRAAG